MSVFCCFSRVFLSLVFGDGYPWLLPKHQGKEDQGQVRVRVWLQLWLALKGVGGFDMLYG